MPPILAVVTIPHTSGFPEDSVQNTWAVAAPAVDFNLPVQSDPIFGAIADFYRQPPPNMGNSVGGFLSAGLSRAAMACSIKAYDLTGKLNGAPHGSPVGEFKFTLPAALGGSPLPEEVALALTLRAAGWTERAVEAPDGPDEGSAGDRPKSRQSGRVFVGPFQSFGAEIVNGRSRPTAELRSNLTWGAETMRRALALQNARLAVWSRKEATFHPMHIEGAPSQGSFSCDNAWDTQRRRGAAPTIRTTNAVGVG
jgi:hypothetical protein